MNKKLFHIEFKSASENEKHFYYGDLTILCKSHEIGISKFTLDRWNFETPFENDICIIRKSELLVSTRPGFDGNRFKDYSDYVLENSNVEEVELEIETI